MEQELFKNPHWTAEDVERISAKTGLKEAQVYKWNWDQKKKLNIIPNKVYVLQIPSPANDSNEMGHQTKLEGRMVHVS